MHYQPILSLVSLVIVSKSKNTDQSHEDYNKYKFIFQTCQCFVPSLVSKQRAVGGIKGLLLLNECKICPKDYNNDTKTKTIAYSL